MNENESGDAANSAVRGGEARNVAPQYADWVSAVDSLLQRGALAEAEELLRRLSAVLPGDANVCVKLGDLLEGVGKLDEAGRCAESAIRLAPNDSRGYLLLGTILIRQNRFSEAVLKFNHGVQLCPSLRDCVAATLRSFRDETVRSCEESLRKTPNNFDALLTLARFRYLDRCPVEALDLLERALRERPGDANARYATAFAQLVLGRFAEGWQNYESRFDTGQAAFPRRRFDQPRWKGQDLRGKTILIYSEQGMGDMIQFIRFADPVAGRGARVIVECAPPLRALIQTHEAVREVVCQGDRLPAFDFQIPLLSLPAALNTTLASIPSRIPYLRVPCGVGPISWPIESGRLRVGLVWAGNPILETDLDRSAPLELFAPLCESDRVQFFSLQIGPARVQLDTVPFREKVADLRAQLKDFAHTAAAIDELDLVISVDTAVAHLAGALARNVWLLLPFAPEWRWMLDRDDSPWYPTMRIFRQNKARDWGDVFERINDALKSKVVSRKLITD